MGAQLDHARALVAQVDVDKVLDALERLDHARRTIAREHGMPPVARWWCGQCAAFIAWPTSRCRKCRHDGPHHYGEDAPTTGNARRRARLYREHRKRNRRTRWPTSGGNAATTAN